MVGKIYIARGKYDTSYMNCPLMKEVDYLCIIFS